MNVIDRVPLIGSGFSPSLPPCHRQATEKDITRGWAGWLEKAPAAAELLAALGTSTAELDWSGTSGVYVQRAGGCDRGFEDEAGAIAAGLAYRVIIRRGESQAEIVLNEDGTRGAVLHGWE